MKKTLTIGIVVLALSLGSAAAVAANTHIVDATVEAANQAGDQGETQTGQGGEQGAAQNGQNGDQGEKQNSQNGDQGEKQNGQTGEGDTAAAATK
jgi:hypothetical protein